MTSPLRNFHSIPADVKLDSDQHSVLQIDSHLNSQRCSSFYSDHILMMGSRTSIQNPAVIKVLTQSTFSIYSSF